MILSKNASDKNFSVREGRHTGPPYFFIGGGVEATSRSTPLFLIGKMYFLRRIQRPTTQGHSSHTKYENSRKIETYRIKPLKEGKKKCVSREFDNEENKHWTKFLL